MIQYCVCLLLCSICQCELVHCCVILVSTAWWWPHHSTSTPVHQKPNWGVPHLLAIPSINVQWFASFYNLHPFPHFLGPSACVYPHCRPHAFERFCLTLAVQLSDKHSINILIAHYIRSYFLNVYSYITACSAD